jgi:RNA polymerase sigma-70 factor (ECF subfamily)
LVLGAWYLAVPALLLPLLTRNLGHLRVASRSLSAKYQGPSTKYAFVFHIIAIADACGYDSHEACGSAMNDDCSETDRLLERATEGDSRALGELLIRHRDRLSRMVHLRLDNRLRGRIDPSDVIQEACLEATERFADYARDPDIPFFLWLRFLTAQKLLVLHRRHLGAQARDAGREVSLDRGPLPNASSAALAAQLADQHTSPSQAAAKAEMQRRLVTALNTLDPIDREILALRHFEMLTNGEAATVLGLRESAASRRYARALLRLKDVVISNPQGNARGVSDDNLGI